MENIGKIGKIQKNLGKTWKNSEKFKKNRNNSRKIQKYPKTDWKVYKRPQSPDKRTKYGQMHWNQSNLWWELSWFESKRLENSSLFRVTRIFKFSKKTANLSNFCHILDMEFKPNSHTTTHTHSHIHITLKKMSWVKKCRNLNEYTYKTRGKQFETIKMYLYQFIILILWIFFFHILFHWFLFHIILSVFLSHFLLYLHHMCTHYFLRLSIIILLFGFIRSFFCIGLRIRLFCQKNTFLSYFCCYFESVRVAYPVDYVTEKRMKTQRRI